jgi:hypothetical protein
MHIKITSYPHKYGIAFSLHLKIKTLNLLYRIYLSKLAGITQKKAASFEAASKKPLSGLFILSSFY